MANQKAKESADSPPNFIQLTKKEKEDFKILTEVKKEKSRERSRKWRANPVNKEKERELDKIRKANPVNKEKARECTRKWRANPVNKEKARELDKIRKANPVNKAKERERDKIRRANPVRKEKARKRDKIRRANPVNKEKARERNKIRKANPVNKEKARGKSRKWRANPANKDKIEQQKSNRVRKEKARERDKIRRANPVSKEKARELSRKWRANPVNKEKARELDKIRNSKPVRKEKDKQRKREWSQKMKLLRQQGIIQSQSNRIGIPQNKLLEYLNLNQDLPFSKTGVNLLAHLQSLSLSDLIKNYPSVVSDKFLKTKKSYWIYILVAVDWKETREPKTMDEVEQIIRSQANNKNKTIYIYAGLNSCGRMANKYHAISRSSTPNKFHHDGFRVFEAHFLNCNIAGLDLKNIAGQKLHQAILEQEKIMRRLEAFIIRYGDSRNHEKFPGMKQRLMNIRMEPLTKLDAIKADQLAASKVEMFTFDKNIRTPPINPAYLFAGSLPFKLLKELKFRN